MKVVSKPVRHFLKVCLWGVEIFLLAALVLFFRLLYGPIDISWMRHFVQQDAVPKFVKGLSVSMDGGSLHLLSKLQLEESRKKDAYIYVYLKPEWMALLSGELKLNEIIISAQDIDLTNLDFSTSSGEKEEDTRKLASFEEKWQASYEAITTYLPQFAESGLDITLVFQDVTVAHLDKLHPVVLPDIYFSATFAELSDLGVIVNLSLKNETMLKNQLMFPDAPLNIQEIEGQLSLKKDAADLVLSKFQLDGAIFNAKIDLTPTKDKLGLAATLSGPHVLAASALKHLWPDTAAQGGHRWVEKNLHAGEIKDLRVDLSFDLDLEGTPHNFALKGGFDIDQARLSYFGELPPVENLKAKASFDLNELTFQVEQGQIGDISLKPGHVRLFEFDRPTQKIAIEIPIEGQVPDILRLIDHAPLGYAKRIDLDPAASTGHTNATLKFDFPLLRNLLFSDVEMHIQGALQETDLLKLPAGLPYQFKNLQADFTITQSGLKMSGKGNIDDREVQLNWDADFHEAAKYGNQLMVQGYAPIEIARRLGVDLDAWLDATIPVHYKVLYQDPAQGEDLLTVQLDVTPLEVNLPWIFYVKPAGASGQFEGKFSFVKDAPFQVKVFTFKSGEDKFVGQILFDAQKKLETINMGASKFLGNEVTKAKIHRKSEKSWDIEVQAQKLDFTPYWQSYILDDQHPEDKTPEETNVTLKVKTENAVLNKPDMPLKETSLSFEMQQGIPAYFKMKTSFENEGRAAVKYQAYQDDRATLEVQAENAGYLLSVMNFVEQAKDGKLEAQASKDSEGVWYGRAALKNFTIQKAPIMARVMSVASITGVTDLLNEKNGITFSFLDAEFSYADKVLAVEKAIASSPSIGIRTKGKIWLDGYAPYLKFKGTFVPVNFLNGVISYIPIIGQILGGDEGEGMFAFKFTVKGSPDSPEVDVNPLSVLTPGILRKIFD